VRGLIGGSNVRLAALRDVICMVHNHCPGIFYLAAGIIVDAGPGTISHTLSTGGKLYPRSGEVFSRLRERGVDTYVASGDSMRNLRRLADRLDIPLGNVFDTTSPEDKEDIVNRLKQRYSHVVMVGDGLNDLLAIRAADTGVVTRQQGDSRPSVLLEAADNVIDDIARVVDIVFPLLG
jgi:Cu+-exporting ATPase